MNVIPFIGALTPNDYTDEEMKMQNEGRKILHLPELKVTCSCVRVPVMRSHSIAVTLRTERKISVEEAKEAVRSFPGCRLIEDYEGRCYPTPLDTSGQDLVWVGGGSVVNLLAVWRAHGLDQIFRRVWQAGVVLGGVSAGSICWFQGGTTDSFGPELRGVGNGLALLPYGNGVHYDSEARRRPLIHALVAAGELPETHCSDDGVGLVYRGTSLVEAVAERAGKGGYIVRKVADSVEETRIEPRFLS